MKSDILLFRLSCLMYAVSALSVLLTFLGDYNGKGAAPVFAVLTGVLFWFGLVAGTVLLVMVNRHRKRYSDIRRRGAMGVLTFFDNRTAAVFDVAMVVMLILFVVTMFVPIFGQEHTLIAGAFFLLSLYMHSLFNGVNLKYIKSL